jgi:hypothetical protein
MVVIGAFLIFYGITLIYERNSPNICNNCQPYAGLDKVTSTLGPIVAAIIGYYFGQRPVQALQEQARDTRNVARDNATDVLSQIINGQKTYDQIIKELESIKGGIGE